MSQPLTDMAIKETRPPTSGTVTLWDGSLKGFGLRVSHGGTKTFIVLIASGRRQRIGRYPLMTLADARKAARRILAEKTLGKVRPTHTAFEDARDRFLGECEKRNRPRTVADYRRLLTRHYPFGRRSLADITPRDILRRLNALDDVLSEKHHAHVVGRIFFRWAVRQHLIERSPMENLTVPPAGTSRERVLTEEELKAVYRHARSSKGSFERIVLLLLLTGQRRGEIAALRWDWIDQKRRTITIPAAHTKNKREHTFPYGRTAAALFRTLPRYKDRPYVFPAARQPSETTTVFNGWGKPKARFDEASGVTGWTLHDLRRTFSSGMAALGISQTVAEKLLNHVSQGTQSPIAQTYNRYTYLPEMRQAVLLWDRHLHRLLRPKG